MTIAVGDKVPSVTLTHMVGNNPADITTEELFAGKKVVLFALPGAFTPTCSAKHLPGFVELADKLFAKGVDSILCLSVNDAYVMGAWGEQPFVEINMDLGGGEGPLQLVTDELIPGLGGKAGMVMQQGQSRFLLAIAAEVGVTVLAAQHAQLRPDPLNRIPQQQDHFHVETALLHQPADLPELVRAELAVVG